MVMAIWADEMCWSWAQELMQNMTRCMLVQEWHEILIFGNVLRKRSWLHYNGYGLISFHAITLSPSPLYKQHHMQANQTHRFPEKSHAKFSKFQNCENSKLTMQASSVQTKPTTHSLKVPGVFPRP